MHAEADGDDIAAILVAIARDYPDAHTESMTGRARMTRRAGMLRMGQTPQLMTDLIPDQRLIAEVNAAAAFLVENNLISTAYVRPTNAALTAAQWGKIVGAYNVANRFADHSRPHLIRPLAFVIAARHVGLTGYMFPDLCTQNPALPSWPVYAITRRAYLAAGLSWRDGRTPSLERSGHL